MRGIHTFYFRDFCVRENVVLIGELENIEFFVYLSMDTNLARRKISSGANDFISIFVHALSFECCEILQTFECRGSLLRTVADKLFI